MNRSVDRLYELLPVIYRQRDVEQAYALRGLLRIINEQVDVLEDDIGALYENWFIETCASWVVPYIGDLIGYRPVSEAGTAGPAGTPQGEARNKILMPRREVANTLAYRRRKGTLALLEVLAQQVAAWPARAVEFYTLLAWTQHLKHLRLQRAQTLALRDGDALDLVHGPFERTAHSVDVRRVVSGRSPGRYNIPSVGLFVWRLRAYSITHAPAYCVEGAGAHCYTFNVLGHDTPLYTRPEPEPAPTDIAGEINLPVPIRRRALEQRLRRRPLQTQVAEPYYGAGKSLAVWAPDWPSKGAPQPVPRELLVPADLTDWRYRAPRGRVAVDPVLGRLVFPANQLPKQGVWANYHYGFSADMGAGEYPRVLSQLEAFMFYKVSKDVAGPELFDSIGAALSQWRADQQALGPEPADAAAKEAWRQQGRRLRAAVIEIQDSSAYSEPLTVHLQAGESLQIRAADRRRPVLRLLDYLAARPDAFMVRGQAGSRFTLDGLVVTGRGLQVHGPEREDPDVPAAGDLCDIRIRHCTLVPGWGLRNDCEPERPNEPSLELIDSQARVRIEHSIIGSIYVSANEVTADPVDIAISDSIVDATRTDRLAVGAPNLPCAFARLTLVRCTVFGQVHSHAIVLGENTLFMGQVRVARRQLGCLRFCYVPPLSRTPRRYQCQPDLVIAAVDQRVPPVPAARRAREQARAAQRVRPRFTSVRYGHPGYAQLAVDCAAEILRGADDEAEMGAFHDLYQAQRAANLRVRLQEYTPAGMATGILYANTRREQ